MPQQQTQSKSHVNKPKPNPSILQISPYVGGKSAAAPGVKVVKLSSNETPLGPSKHAIEAYKNAVENLHRYPDGSAQELRDAIAQTYNLPAKNIACGNGSDELIGLLVQAYAGEGDEVLISEHGFLMYEIYAKSHGADIVKAPEKNLRTDVDAMLARVTDKTKIVFIANPNNPTGSYITSDEIVKLHNGLPSHVILAIDGAYSEYLDKPDYTDGHELVSKADNVVMMRTFSKIYGLSALRLGWMYAPDGIIDVISRIRSPFNVNTPALKAGVAAVKDVQFTDDTRIFNNTQLAWLEKQVTALGLKIYPSVGNFILVEFPEGPHNASAANDYMCQKGLIPREVKNYGLPNHLRISIGLEEDNKAVVETLKSFLAQ